MRFLAGVAVGGGAIVGVLFAAWVSFARSLWNRS